MPLLQLLEVLQQASGLSGVVAVSLEFGDYASLRLYGSLTDGNMLLDKCQTLHECKTIHKDCSSLWQQ